MSSDDDSMIDAFWQAQREGIHFPPAWFGKLDLDQAYRVQLGLIGRRCAAGERQIGWKVGLTAVPIQQQFGFHEPVFGCVLESRPSGHVFAPGDLISPGFENELCMRLGQRCYRRDRSRDGAAGNRCGLSVTGDHRDTRAVHRADRPRAGRQRPAEDGHSRLAGCSARGAGDHRGSASRSTGNRWRRAWARPCWAIR